jgi:hypothetical protein
MKFFAAWRQCGDDGRKSRDSSPLFGKALYYGAAGISEKLHNIGLRPGERIHSFPPAYLAARCSGGARRTSGLQPGDLLNGPLPWVDNRDLFAYDFGWFYCTEQASGRRNVDRLFRDFLET